MKIRETSNVEVVDSKNHSIKGGFIDIHDAMEYVINTLGEGDEDKGHSVLIIKQEITIIRTR